MERIQHLYHHTGGQNIGILFLLNEKTPKGNGKVAFMDLQVRYVPGCHHMPLPTNTANKQLLSLFPTLEMPIIPLFSLTSLEATLTSFQRQFAYQRRSSTTAVPANPGVSLLPYCTNNPPLPEHARNVVSDICRSLSAVSRAATSEDGQLGLREYLDGTVPGAAQDVIDFWAEEIIVA